MSLSRLLEITNLLLVNKTLSAKYLADYFDVSTRTIYRDIDKLTLANIPIYANKGKNGGFSLLEEYTINKQIIDKDDQLRIINALNDIPISSNISTINKLNALFNVEKRDWIQIDFKPWHEISDSNIFDSLKSAILDSKKINFEYCSNNGKISIRNICPFKIYFKAYGWYLVGYDLDREDYRIYKITRLTKLMILDEFDYSIFDKIDLKKLFYIDENDNIKEKVVFKINKMMAFRVYDDFKSHEVEEVSDGFIIKTEAVLNEWYYNYLLSYTTNIEIIEPLILKDRLKSLLKEMVEKI
ncbi:putative DNA-binding transcriptional regulator YafY [Bacilli bacterium PM5-3]|nr:putative DNA-binding transcriptional regulator YafY [Bacilli bacterium PM5-3]